MKKQLVIGIASALIIGTGTAVLAVPKQAEQASKAPELSVNTPAPASRQPFREPAPVASESVTTITQDETPAVTPAPAPVTPTETAPVQSVRSYDDLVDVYNFKGTINTESLEALRTLYPERFTPEKIEQTFRYLRNISSSIDHNFVRTYGWDLPQYQ